MLQFLLFLKNFFTPARQKQVITLIEKVESEISEKLSDLPQVESVKPKAKRGRKPKPKI